MPVKSVLSLLFKKSIFTGLCVYVESGVTCAKLGPVIKNVEKIEDADLVISNNVRELINAQVMTEDTQLLSFTSTWVYNVIKGEINLQSGNLFATSDLTHRPVLVSQLPTVYSGRKVLLTDMNGSMIQLFRELLTLANARHCLVSESQVDHVIYGRNIPEEKAIKLGGTVIQAENFVETFGNDRKFCSVQLEKTGNTMKLPNCTTLEALVSDEFYNLVELLSNELEGFGFLRFFPKTVFAEDFSRIIGTQTRVIVTPQVGIDEQQLTFLLQTLPTVKVMTTKEVPATWENDLPIMETASHHPDKKTAVDAQTELFDYVVRFLGCHILGSVFLEAEAVTDEVRRKRKKSHSSSHKYLLHLKNVVIKSDITKISENIFRTNLVITSAILLMLREMSEEFGATPINPQSRQDLSRERNQCKQENWTFIQDNPELVQFRNGETLVINSSISEITRKKFIQLCIRSFNVKSEIERYEKLFSLAGYDKNGILSLKAGESHGVFACCFLCKRKAINALSHKLEIRQIVFTDINVGVVCISCKRKCKTPKLYYIYK